MPISARVITGVFDTPVFEGWPRSSSRASERGQFAATVRAARGDPEISSNILEHFLKTGRLGGGIFAARLYGQGYDSVGPFGSAR